MSAMPVSGRDVTTPYQFDRCDECGTPLEPEARLYGLCGLCHAKVLERLTEPEATAPTGPPEAREATP